MSISFRTRLFLIAALIVATVLASVMAAGWSSVLRFEVGRLDARLCMEAKRLAKEPYHGDELPRLEADVLVKLRLTSPDQLMLRFNATDKESSFQSAHWNSKLNTDELNWTLPEPPSPSVAQKIRPNERPAQDSTRPARREDPSSDDCAFSSFTLDGNSWRAARYSASPGRGILAANLAAPKAEIASALYSALKLVIPLALLLSAFGAWLLSSYSMRPVNRLREAMKALTQKELDQRLPSSGEDFEFRELINAYNTMLGHLEVSFQQATRFSSDAAHELKTPLTILQGRIEQAVSRSDHRAIQSELTEMLDEVGRLSDITRKLLLLSQADAGKLALNIEPVNLTELLDELIADTQMLIGNQELSSFIERDLVAKGDRLLMRQLFNNLISNAARYCPPAGRINVDARKRSAGIEVTFNNTSHLIPEADRSRFFDRFYRGDPAHNRLVEGSGLGLSLAREIARAHGGDLTLEPSADNEVRLRLSLPLE